MVVHKDPPAGGRERLLSVAAKQVVMPKLSKSPRIKPLWNYYSHQNENTQRSARIGLGNALDTVYFLKTSMLAV